MFNKKENLKEEELNEEIEVMEEQEELTEENKEIESLKAEIEKLKADNTELKNDYLRKHAEFQNFTKRKEKEMQELREFASEKIITKLLDGLDNLERAIAASSETKDFDGLVQGVEMILGQLKDIMKAEGVEAIDATGQCDPMYHHAVLVEDSEDHNDNDITMELQKGYTMKGKVIRPSMVKVCKK